jgi:hypothetical protein
MAFGPGVDEELVGQAHNIFVAKIIQHTGGKSQLASGERQYSAEVVYNVKGELSDLVTINEQRGTPVSGLQEGVTFACYAI